VKKLRLRVVALCILTPLFSFGSAAQTPSVVPADLEIPFAPTPVRADGRMQLVYELHITNFDRRARQLTLTSLEVFGDKRGAAPLDRYEGQELIDRLERPGAPKSLPDKRRIAGGMRAVVFMWLTFDVGGVPATLRHRLTFTIESVEGERSVECAGLTVHNVQPLMIGPPLRGEGWMAANGPSNDSEHRRSINVIGGKARISQRFAIDWIKFGRDGQIGSGVETKNASYYSYGSEVISVADATVAAVKDGVPENVPGSPLPDLTLETQAGNFIVLNLGGGLYASYGHLQPGSLRVKAGDRVRRGQVIGLVGNSGNSDAPHLHFQVTDGDTPPGVGAIAVSEGAPYVIDSFEVQGTGKLSDTDATWKPFPGGRTEKRHVEIPLDNAVVRFL
jgi:murein DD-endopeptidase